MAEAEKQFPQEAELQEKSKRLAELDALLNMHEKDSMVLDEGIDECELPERDKGTGLVR